MTFRRFEITLAIIALFALGACQQKESAPTVPAKSGSDESAKKAATAPAAPPAAAFSPDSAPQPNPDRNAYFGEEHIHTSWSVDAWVMGNRITGPADALKYAQGETIKHPMGFDIKIDTPMDFMGVTDHSEYVGVTREANTPGSYVSKIPEAQPMIMKDPTSAGRAKPGLLVSAQAQFRRAGEGAHGPEDHFHRVEGKRQDRRRAKQARQVHRVLLVRVDVDAGQPQHAPQRLLQGLRQGAGLSVQLARLHSPHGTVELDGRAAQGGQRAPRHLAQRERERRLDVPGRCRPNHRAADRCGLGGRTRPQRAPGRDQAGQGTIGDASPAVAQRRVRRLRDVSGSSRPSGQHRPHRPHHGQLRAPGVQGRHRDAGHARLQPVQVRHGRRLRLAQHRQPVPPGQLLRLARRRGRVARAAFRRRAHRRHHGRAPGKPRRADRRMGGGEHAGLDLRRDVPQGDLRRQRPAHQGSPLRGLGLQQGHPEGRRLGEAILRRRRPHGRRPAAHAIREGDGPGVRRLGGEGSDLRQPRPHPDREGLDAERPEFREGLRRRLVRRPQARQVVRQGSADPEHGGPPDGHLHQQRRFGGIEDACGRIRSSTRASMRSTTPA